MHILREMAWLSHLLRFVYTENLTFYMNFIVFVICEFPCNTSQSLSDLFELWETGKFIAENIQG